MGTRLACAFMLLALAGAVGCFISSSQGAGPDLSGFQVLADWRADAVQPSRVTLESSGSGVIGELLQSAAAPESPPDFARLMATGSPGSIRGHVDAVPLTAVYASLWVRFESDWSGPGGQGGDLAVGLGSIPDSDPSVFLSLMSADASAADLRVTGLAVPYRGSTHPVLQANKPPIANAPIGDWAHWQILVGAATPGNRNGWVRWWVDGSERGYYTGLRWFAGLSDHVRRVSIRLQTGTVVQALDVDHLTLMGRPTGDAVLLTKLSTADAVQDSRILMDAERVGGECVEDLVVSGPKHTEINFVTRQACAGPDQADEVVAFSVGDAVRMVGGSASSSLWTDTPTDWVELDMSGGPIEVPVKFWSLVDTAGGLSIASAVKDWVDEANKIFHENRTGIVLGFDPVQSLVLAGPLPGASSAISDFCNSGLASYSAAGDTVNVYVVDKLGGSPQGECGAPVASPETYAGWHCREIDWGALYVATAQMDKQTVAHEFGHVLGLEHTAGPGTLFGDSAYVANNSTLFGESNLMWGRAKDSPPRSKLSLGQVYRMNISALSWINQKALRGPGAITKTCECAYHACGCDTAFTSTMTDSERTVANYKQFIDESKVAGRCPSVPKQWD